MNKNTRCLLFAVLATVAFAASPDALTPEAAALSNPFVRIDNFPNGGTIASTGTPNLITVRVRYCQTGSFTALGSKALGVSGTNDYPWTQTGAANGALRISDIEVSTNGDNWLWIDQMELFDELGAKIWSAGADDTIGWCISTDPSDGNNAVCEPDGSLSSRTWHQPASGCPNGQAGFPG